MYEARGVGGELSVNLMGDLGDVVEIDAVNMQ
jgi:hypothetical protein